MNPVQYTTFHHSKSGLFTANRDRAMVEGANREALEWINRQQGIEVISICSSHGRMSATTTVWFRKL